MENKILKQITIIGFFEIDNWKKEYSNEANKEIIINYPILLNETNWDEYKDTFKNKRFNTYKKSLTDKEIIVKEKVRINIMLNELGSISWASFSVKDTFKTLANRYIDYLKELPLTQMDFIADLEHYKSTKRFLFQGFLKPFKKNEYKSVISKIEIYEIRYYFIYNYLEDEDKIEFKCDTLDHLKRVNEVQTLLKFRKAIEGLINRIDVENKPKKSKRTEQNIIIEEELTLSKKVEKAFAFMQGNDPRKHQLILNKDDFDKLINWVTYYFENNFELPEITKSIQQVNTNKGNVIYTFLRFFKYIHPDKTRPESLFELIKACFYEYRKDDTNNFKKQKKPQYYDDLISNND